MRPRQQPPMSQTPVHIKPETIRKGLTFIPKSVLDTIRNDGPDCLSAEDYNQFRDQLPYCLGSGSVTTVAKVSPTREWDEYFPFIDGLEGDDHIYQELRHPNNTIKSNINRVDLRTNGADIRPIVVLNEEEKEETYLHYKLWWPRDNYIDSHSSLRMLEKLRPLMTTKHYGKFKKAINDTKGHLCGRLRIRTWGRADVFFTEGRGVPLCFGHPNTNSVGQICYGGNPTPSKELEIYQTLDILEKRVNFLSPMTGPSVWGGTEICRIDIAPHGSRLAPVSFNPNTGGWLWDLLLLFVTNTDILQAAYSYSQRRREVESSSRVSLRVLSFNRHFPSPINKMGEEYEEFINSPPDGYNDRRTKLLESWLHQNLTATRPISIPLLSSAARQISNPDTNPAIKLLKLLMTGITNPIQPPYMSMPHQPHLATLGARQNWIPNNLVWKIARSLDGLPQGHIETEIRDNETYSYWSSLLIPKGISLRDTWKHSHSHPSDDSIKERLQSLANSYGYDYTNNCNFKLHDIFSCHRALTNDGT